MYCSNTMYSSGGKKGGAHLLILQEIIFGKRNRYHSTGNNECIYYLKIFIKVAAKIIKTLKIVKIFIFQMATFTINPYCSLTFIKNIPWFIDIVEHRISELIGDLGCSVNEISDNQSFSEKTY